MPLQAFGLGERNRRGTKPLDSLSLILLDCNELQEVRHAEATANSRQTACWQCVIWARDVVAHGLCRIAANEDRARVGYPFQVSLRVNRQMLRSEAVCQVPRFGN